MRGITHTAVRWTLRDDPRPRGEEIDLLTLSDDELLPYVRDLQAETRWVRAALHEALTLLQRVTAAKRARRRPRAGRTG